MNEVVKNSHKKEDIENKYRLNITVPTAEIVKEIEYAIELQRKIKLLNSFIIKTWKNSPFTQNQIHVCQNRQEALKKLIQILINNKLRTNL